MAMDERLPLTTLAALLQDDMIPIETLVERHGAAATIAKALLGIVPRTGKFLEIWPPANRMYYVMVPSFLNLPAFMFGFGAPKHLVSLALFVSSLAAGCPYCTSHTCTFALRRGVDAKKLEADAVMKHREVFTPVEKSVVDVAEALAQVPSTLTAEKRRALQEQLQNDAATTEAVLLGVAMMGYLNKAMDALGIPLETQTYRETRDVLGHGWAPGRAADLLNPAKDTAASAPSRDSVGTYWGMITNGLSAASFERKALAGIPDNAADAQMFLQARFGYDFPVLSRMHHARAICAVTAMLHESFNEDASVIGVRSKLAIAQIFSTITQSPPLQQAVDAMTKHFNVDAAYLAAARAFAQEQELLDALDTHFAHEEPLVRAMLALAHAASWSPTRIDERVVLLCRDAEVPSPALVEVVAVTSTLQMLHRVSTFYLLDEAAP